MGFVAVGERNLQKAERHMLFRDLVEKQHIRFCESFSCWEDAVEASCKPFLQDGSISHDYIDDVISCIRTYGPYIVLAPHIAMPHAQEKARGVYKTGICFMKVEQPVEFEPGNPDKNAELFFSLAAADHTEHLEQMQKLAFVLLQPTVVERLLNITSIDELLELDDALEGMGT